MDKEMARVMHKDVETVMALVAERHGVKLIMKGGSFTDRVYKPRIEFVELVDSDATNVAQQEWNTYCHLLGFEKSDYLRHVLINGRRAKLVAIKPRNRKYPVIVEMLDDNSRRKCTQSSVYFL